VMAIVLVLMSETGTASRAPTGNDRTSKRNPRPTLFIVGSSMGSKQSPYPAEPAPDINQIRKDGAPKIVA